MNRYFPECLNDDDDDDYSFLASNLLQWGCEISIVDYRCSNVGRIRGPNCVIVSSEIYAILVVIDYQRIQFFPTSNVNDDFGETIKNEHFTARFPFFDSMSCSEMSDD